MPNSALPRPFFDYLVARSRSALKLAIATGSAIALTGCAEFQLGARPTRFLSIQPIQVCDDFGLICADLALFEEATRKIWAQAAIEISFLAPNQLRNSRFLTIDSRDEFAEMSFQGGPGAFGRNPLSRRDSGPISMWFVEEIIDGIADVFGLAWIDQNGIVISDNILDFNNGIGRQDTVAHEIGHNLGLTHSNFGAGSPTNLMSSGGVRAIPSRLDDITPDGPLDRLNSDQIEFARNSSLVREQAGLPSNPPIFTLPPLPLPLLDDADADYDAVGADAFRPPTPLAGEFRVAHDLTHDPTSVPEPGLVFGLSGVFLWLGGRRRLPHG